MQDIDSIEFGWEDWTEDYQPLEDPLCGPLAEFALSLAVPPSKKEMMDELGEKGPANVLYNHWLVKKVKEFLVELSENNIKFDNVESPTIRIASMNEAEDEIEFIEGTMRRAEVRSVEKVQSKPMVSDLLFNLLIHLISIFRPKDIGDTLLSPNHYILISRFTIVYHIDTNGNAGMKLEFWWIPFKKN